MNIQANIPAGETSITAHGLHQWDYGRKLDITSPALTGLGMIAVHFACAGMQEAVVRHCEVAVQSITAAIPDVCLQQASPIYAWVYVPTAAEGYTVLTVTLPVTPRTKPAGHATEPPADLNNKYIELINAVSDLVAHTYTRAELDAMLGAYITDVDALVGGDD